MQPQEHWEHIYATRSPGDVSWFQEHAELSLRLIRDTCVPLTASITDVGGGASTLMDDLLQGGYTRLIVATFAEDGPTHCSGLPVMRFRPDELHTEFGAPFILLHHEKDAHPTPSGTVQMFVYCYCRLNADRAIR